MAGTIPLTVKFVGDTTDIGQKLTALENRANYSANRIAKSAGEATATSTKNVFSKKAIEDLENAGFSKGHAQAAKRWGWGQSGKLWSEQPKEKPIIQDSEKEIQKALKAKTQFFKDLTFLFQPLLNPTSPWGNMFAARQTFSAFSGEYGQSQIGGGGTAGALKATAMLQGSALAVGLTLKGLEKAISFTVNEIGKSIQFAHSLYAKSLQSGMSLQFTAQRQMTASALGVDEKDLFRFAQAGQVMAKLSDAAGDVAKNAPKLAYTAAQWKILQFDVMAAGSKLAVDLAPSMNKFIDWLDKIAKKVSAVVSEYDAVGVFNSKKQFFLDQHKGMNFSGRQGTDLLKKMFHPDDPAFVAAWQKTQKTDNQTFGNPQTFMKQLPADAFEKMGLVIGGGMADKALEYQRRTATAVEKLYQAATASSNKTSGYYLGRNPYVAGH